MRMPFVRGIAALSLALTGTAVQAASLATWTFETSVPTTSGPHAAESGVFAATSFASGSHASVPTYDNPSGNGSAESFSSNNWAIGDYYQFRTSSDGYENLSIAFDQISSTTGPRDFTLAYSTDGTSFTNFADYSVRANVSPNWTSSTPLSQDTYTFDLASIPALDDAATIYFRLIQRTNEPANAGSTFRSSGTDRVDNVTVTGDAIPSPVPLPSAALGGVALLGLLTARRSRAAL